MNDQETICAYLAEQAYYLTKRIDQAVSNPPRHFGASAKSYEHRQAIEEAQELIPEALLAITEVCRNGAMEGLKELGNKLNKALR